MFGGLPTPTETEAPEHNVLAGPPPPLTANSAADGEDYDGEDSGSQQHLTTSQSAHITLR